MKEPDQDKRNKMKCFEIELNDNDQKKAEQKVDDMCKKLLANLIIEDYKVSKI